MGFFNPLAFVLTPLAALIILLYFARSRPQKKTLSSTYLWRMVMNRVRPNSIWQRFRNSLFLLLQLLALALGIFALARPYWSMGIYGDVILVLDRTASMGATDQAPSRFEAARRAALETLERVEPQTRILLASYGRQLRVIEPFTSDKERIRAALRGQAPSDESGAGVEALWSFLDGWAKDRFPEIHVFTDTLELSHVPKALEEARLRFHVFGSSGDNFAITGLQIERVDRSCEIAVELANFGAASGKLRFELSQASKVLVTRDLPIDAGGHETLRLEKLPLEVGLVHLRIRPLGGGQDHLAADDEVRVSVESGGLRVLWVSARPDPVLQRLLGLNPAIRLRIMPPGKAADLLVQPCDFYLLDQYWDPAFAERSFLSFASEGGARPWAGKGGVFSKARIGVVDGTHGLTRYLSFSGVSVSRAVPLALPSDARCVVDSDRGPLVAVREAGAARQIVCAFHLASTDFSLRVGFPIFMANALRWLANRDLGAVRSHRPGEILRLAPAGKKLVVESAGASRVVTAPGGGSSLALDLFSRVGSLTLRYDGRTLICPVNLLDGGESAIRPAEEGKLRHEPRRPPSTGQGASRLWRYFAMACLLVVFFEWSLFCRKGA